MLSLEKIYLIPIYNSLCYKKKRTKWKEEFRQMIRSSRKFNWKYFESFISPISSDFLKENYILATRQFLFK